MTLIEIMIVVALIASLMAIATVGLGVLGQADVSGEALKLSSAIRYTFTLAATTNMTLQMKLNFDERRYYVEELVLSGGLSDEELSGTTMKSSQTEAFKRKSDRANRMDDEDSKFGTVTRTPVDSQFLSGEDAQLADGVYFVGIMTSHHDEIQTSGEGTMNFFSNGFVERAVIYVGDEAAAQGLEEGVVYTITVNPLTGQSSVVPGKTEISSSFFEEEEDD